MMYEVMTLYQVSLLEKTKIQILEKCRAPCLANKENLGLRNDRNGKFRTFSNKISLTLTCLF